MSTHFDFSEKFNKKRLQEFADMLQQMSRKIGFKVSSRGWCYLMEQANYIDKSQFSKVENAINTCRKDGYLPVDFVADEDARSFSGVENPTNMSTKQVLQQMLDDVLDGHRFKIPDWWADELYYIQVVVEKIDLKTLFRPICEKYHIPIANAKGWSSILQRAEYAARFRDAEMKGMKCVLLYCGDHDADGLRISDTIRKNLEQVADVHWSDGKRGYDPTDLIIERFGLNYDFIVANGYTWIDNLMTGRGRDLADPNHRNYNLPYVQAYIKKYGERKCEANVIVTSPRAAEKLMEQTILKYLGPDAEDRFEARRQVIEDEYNDLLDSTGIRDIIDNLPNI